MGYEEIWAKTHCDECKKCNWICDGDIQDATVPDTEAIECWNCGHKCWRDPDYALDMYGEEDTTMDYHLGHCSVKGKESP